MDNIKNNDKPKVSVVMNCLNCSEYVKEAIDSVFTQTYKDWEIIFFDDASTDNSLEIAKSYGHKVRCFTSGKTYGLGKARNLAVKEARGRYIAFLDCDDIWLPEKLEKQIPMFDNDQNIGLVFSDVMYFNKKGDVFQLYGAKKPPENYAFRQLLRKNFLCLSDVMIKKETLLKLGQWFDDRFSGIEDLDLFLRIAYDQKIKYIDAVLVRYRMHEKSWTYSHRSIFPEEQEILIKKLSDLYPGLKKEYSSELNALQVRIAYEKFVLYWKTGEVRNGRQYLKQFLVLDRKLLLPYIFSYFLPYSFFTFFIRMSKMRVYSI